MIPLLDRPQIWADLAMDLCGKEDPELIPIYPEFKSFHRCIKKNPKLLLQREQELIWRALDAMLDRLRLVQAASESWICTSADIVAYYVDATDCDPKWLLDQAGIDPHTYERDRKSKLSRIIKLKVIRLRTTII